MKPYGDQERPKLAGGASRDKKRLAVGIGFMLLLFAATLVSAFVLGRPMTGAVVAPGVPFLILSGWGIVIAAALVFYRTYRGG